VVFARPSDAVVKKWQLAPYHDFAHIITMPHVTRDLVDKLTEDIERDKPPAAPGRTGS
jgi:histidine decarboxylase